MTCTELRRQVNSEGKEIREGGRKFRRKVNSIEIYKIIEGERGGGSLTNTRGWVRKMLGRHILFRKGAKRGEK